MIDETCKIYFSLHPPTEKVIALKDREKYLSCKFWSATQREADLFYTYYPGEIYAELHRIVGILSGWLIKKDDLMRAYAQLTKLINVYRFYGVDKVNRHFKRLPLFKKILDGITQDKNYPNENLLDDVLEWCRVKTILDEVSINEIKQKINNTRHQVYHASKVSFEFSVEIIRLLVKHNRSILYADAKILFFPERELLSELSSAVVRGEVFARYSIPKDIYYFDVCSLIKWLMRQKLFSIEMANEFPDLEIDSVKESLVKYSGLLNSLAKLIRNGYDRNDLLFKAQKQEIIIYLKYPRKYLSWRQNWSKMLKLKAISYFAAQRYDGLGQLKIVNTDDSFSCKFGGLTIDMLMQGEKPEYCTSKPVYEIEFVLTKREYDAGLQPFVKIPTDEIDKILSDENLIVVEINNHTQLNQEKMPKKNVSNINHHVKKRTTILRAATAVTYRYIITSGKDVLGLIKDNISCFFEGNNILPHSDRVNIDLINKYLRPLNECEFNNKLERPFEDERIFGAALSLVFHFKAQLNSINRDEASKLIAEKILAEKLLLNISLSLDSIKNMISDAFFQVT